MNFKKNNELEEGLLTSNKREIPQIFKKIQFVLLPVFALYILYSIVYSYPYAIIHRSLFLTVYLVLTFLTRVPTKKVSTNRKLLGFDIFCALLSVIIFIYLYIDTDRLIFRRAWIDPVFFLDQFFAIVLVILLFLATIRVIGTPLAVLSIFGVFYSYIGKYLPGLWGHYGFSIKQIIEQQFLASNGIFGMPLGIASSYIFVFILFGAFLTVSKSTDFIIDFSKIVAGKTVGGTPKTAIVASALFGSVSGSPTANVATTGAFTIPLMIKNKYPPHYAAAVEASASTGGTIMPPVMGAVAFLMAEVLGIRYIDVCKAAAVPAILYYFTLFLQIDFKSRYLNIKGIDSEDLPKMKNVFIRTCQLAVPFFWLVYRLMVGYTAIRAAAESILIVIVLSWLRKESRMYFKQILKALEKGVLTAIPVSIACAAAGLFIGSIELTGTSCKVSSIILSFSRGQLIPVLLFTALGCIILGMGMNISPNYLISATIFGAPLTAFLGVPKIVAHMFILYFVAFSTITPPVATTSYAGASIAGADPIKTGFLAFRMAILAFILPFVFIFNPSFLLIGSTYVILKSILLFIIGIVFVVGGMERWLLGVKLNHLERGISIAIGIMFFFNLILAALAPMLIFIIYLVFIKRRKVAVPK